MPTSLHPQAKFDPIPPDLDLHAVVDRTPNFKWVQRVSRSQIRSLGQQEFEKLVLIHVIIGGKPLVIDGWDAALTKRLFNVDWLEQTYDKKQENVRDIPASNDIPMTMGHYLRSMKQLTNQWTPNNVRDERRQRLYLKDIDCPPEWRQVLQKVIHPSLFYLNENLSKTGAARDEKDDDDMFRSETTAAPAGDLMSSLPESMQAQNLMCYIGHEGTYTPAHREMCASLGQNIMVEASGDQNGEKPGSSIWFMTESKDREVVREYFLSMLGHDIEIEKHFAQINAWKKAPFDVYIVEQRAGDFIIIPPLAAHQVWNRGTRTMKVAWNRTTPETLDLALHEALPKARLVCRDEQYKNKAIIYYTLQKYYAELLSLEENAEKTQLTFLGLGQDIGRNSPRAKQLANDFKKLFSLFTEVLIDETFAFKEKEVEFLPFDSCVTCSYCRSNIFNRFLTCKHCVRMLINGDEDAYDVCMECYAMGRSCACMSGLQWCEQWAWPELVDSYEMWRGMVILNDGFVDVESSPLPFEVARQRSGKKSVAQICQEALRRRPWKDITKPEIEIPPSDSEAGEDGTKQKKPKRKKKKGELLRCHVCAHKDYTYRVHQCTNPGCNEAYCYGVLYRAFDLTPQKVLEDENWQCPKCLGICNCGYCRRIGNPNAYTPKNTSLGHDTRPIADDRSVEALVDFRVHNLSWLKATGEESRSKDSRRMQRLREQADNAKAQDLTEQVDAERRIRDEANNRTEDGTAASVSNGAMNGYGDQSHVVGNEGTSLGEHETTPMPVDGALDVQAQPEDDGHTARRDASGEEEPDASEYPDPSVFTHHRIGMGYYEQDDTPDKILFDPYQAPSKDALQLSEPDVPEFVKKSIRAAKRKAKRDNDDPDFTVAKSHYKKPRINNKADAIDNMDPALFGEACPAADAAHTLDLTVEVLDGERNSQDHDGDATAQDSGKQAQKKLQQPRFDANEPALRHAKPRASYVEFEDAEIDEVEEEEPLSLTVDPADQPENPANNDMSAIDLAAASVRAIFNKSKAQLGEALETPNGTPTAPPRRRGRPPKSLSTAAIPSIAETSVPSNASPEVKENVPKKRRGRPSRASLAAAAAAASTHEASVPVDEEVASPAVLSPDIASSAFEEAAEQNKAPPQRRKRGRPSRNSIAGAVSTPSQSPAVSARYAMDARSSRGRGRPPKARPSEPMPASHTKISEDTQFMSMADRMALKGKKFKIGKRQSNGKSSAEAASAPTPVKKVTPAPLESAPLESDEEEQAVEEQPESESDDQLSAIYDSGALPEKRNSRSSSAFSARVPEPKSPASSEAEVPTSRPQRRRSGPTIVSLADYDEDDDDDAEVEVDGRLGSLQATPSATGDSSDDDEDIPPRRDNTATRGRPAIPRASGRGRSRGRGRGRPRGRGRGRPRGS